MQSKIEHINSPTIIYGLIRIHSTSFFSFNCWHDKIDGIPNDTFSIYVTIGKISQFKLALQYMILETMPNIQTTCVNFTLEKPSKIYRSNTFLTAHLIGFTSSQFAKDNFFFAIKETNTYHLYTITNLTRNNWISFRLIILHSVYVRQGILCLGSHIDSYFKISNHSNLKQIQNHSNLIFMLGIEAIYQQPVKFQFAFNQKILFFLGTYSYSVVAINTTCIYLDQKRQLSPRAKVYKTVVFIFLILIVASLFCIFIYCIVVKYCDQKCQILEQFKQQSGGSESDCSPIKTQQVLKPNIGIQNSRIGNCNQQINDVSLNHNH